MPTFTKLPTREAYRTLSIPRSKGTAIPSASVVLGRDTYVDTKTPTVIQATWVYRRGRAGQGLVKAAR